ncbi:PaaX family transcriptional regulator C-terminal domain-containing protein [Nocardia sp. NPDC004860]|uniref:PaaX family transcriptional regulator n=1 Tax=Nocardia sp. NPDC004860 TaxID=3154557 RepID=UPI0033B460DF
MSLAPGVVPDTGGVRGVPAPPTPSPQRLLLAFYGSLVLDREDRQRVRSRILLDMLNSLGVTESAARAALNRMVRIGLLDRTQRGRVAEFGLTPQSLEMLREGRARVEAEDPFTPDAEEWTLLGYTVPELRRDIRHRLRSELAWAGFGRVQDGLWIAPGVVDPRRVLERVDATDVVTFAFAGRPIGGSASEHFVREAWDLNMIESEHRSFASMWSDLRGRSMNPVAAFTALVADWLHLLARDPGLPARFLPEDWPSSQSVRVYRHAHEMLGHPAELMLTRMLDSSSATR